MNAIRSVLVSQALLVEVKDLPEDVNEKAAIF